MANPMSALIRTFGRVATTAVTTSLAQQQASQRQAQGGPNLSKCTPCAARAAVMAARNKARGQR